MGHKAAGCLDSIFWASITIGRLGFIFVSYRFSAPRLLTFSLVGRFDPEGIRDGLEAGEPAQGSIQRSWMCEHTQLLFPLSFAGVNTGSNASALQTSLKIESSSLAPHVFTRSSSGNKPAKAITDGLFVPCFGLLSDSNPSTHH